MAEELRDVEPLRPLLSRKPFALLSDIDGTLAPIVADPGAAQTSVRAMAALRALTQAGVRVGIVTGRALDVARKMIDLPEAGFGANHGLEVLVQGELETLDEARPYIAWAAEVVRDTSALARTPGVLIEEKGPAVAFHYRMADSEHDAIAAIRHAVAKSKAASRFRITEGRKVIELRPPLAIDKGTAAHGLVSRAGAEAVLAIGDDVTDVDMFRAVRSMRKLGTATVSVSVWSRETSPLVLESSDYYVRGVEGVEWLLEELVRAIRL